MTKHHHIIKEIESLLTEAFTLDDRAARNKLALVKRLNRKDYDEKLLQDLNKLKKRLRISAKNRFDRKTHVPKISFYESLPITAKKGEIIDAIIKNQVVIVSGETGSGKTTQLPKFCLAAGRGIDGKVGCTQPRRIAAITVAQRIAFELGQKPGHSVGYKIRFKDVTSKDAFIKIMTDGMLLAETQNDPFLNEYDTIIIDEAHERSLNIDFILGTLKKLLKQREDLKLIITSATLDTNKFSKAFNKAPVIEVSGRMFPVDVRYFPLESISNEANDQTHIDMSIHAIDKIYKETHNGDILLFMPTEQDIRETTEIIKGKNYKNIHVLPLFARLSANEQSKVFSHVTERKIIIATNIAETSITIPGIKYVIDTGLARISHYTPRSRTTSLPVVPVSKSSADQRKGRCGRVENGVCVRLYSEEDYTGRSLYTPPEILRANLAEVILRMIDLNLGNISEFPFIDRPSEKSIQDGFSLLTELGAISDNSLKEKSGKKTKPKYTLTKKGKLMAKIPLDPRLSRMLIEAQQRGCVEDIKVIASVLSLQDPRERPIEKAIDADKAHENFLDPHSDFITLLNIWKHFNNTCKKNRAAAISMSQMKKYCKKHYLSFKRMREWQDIYSQVSAILKEHGSRQVHRNMDVKSKKVSAKQSFTPGYTSIHKSILSGFLSNIAFKKEKNLFHASQNRQAMIFPGSSLFNKAGSWVVAAEMVETSRLFARTTANIDPGWLEDLGGHLCKYKYLHPHWEKGRSEVVATEQVTLFGLIIVTGRIVSYGPVNPEESTEIFIRNALVQCDVKEILPFMEHNKTLVHDIENIENRLRRKDILVSEEDLYEFYRQRLPVCYSLPMLKEFVKQKVDDRFLRMTSEDLSLYFPKEDELSLYPESIKLGDRDYSTLYKYDPGKKEDGVTVQIPSSLAAAVPHEQIDWLVPGLYKDKITALIKGLPKEFRKKLVPLPNTIKIILNEMPITDASLITALGSFIYSRFSVDIPASAWPEKSLPDHLRMRIAITDAKGKELVSSRDKTVLSQHSGPKINNVMTDDIKQAVKKWKRSDITKWDFGDLPEIIHITSAKGQDFIMHPGLEINPQTAKNVNRNLFTTKDEAAISHPLTLPKDITNKSVYFGGAKQFEKILFDGIASRLFKKNVRVQKDFYTHADSIASTILPVGTKLLDSAVNVLDAYHETRSAISNLEMKVKSNSPGAAFLEHMRTELAKLVPENLIELYDIDKFSDIVRYLKAMTVRITRAVDNFEKDQKKADDVAVYTDSLDTLLKSMSASTSEEKKKAIEDFFWMIEEYKISVFAQELKTAVPVSKKRLSSKLKEIERMI
ncbi:MAG: ATP-dependent RNA helicase HrpA [Deltaproteobacteria bacterium]|nr:ATP-dependent RNA helicase HrpA [Deltaproteobacteria bacterium]